MEALAVRDATPVIEITREQVDLVRRTIAPDATEAELQLFFFDCRRHGVHPLDRMLHFTKRQGKYTPITSIDLMRARAAETGELAGSDDAEFVPGDKYPAEATVTVYRMTAGNRYPYTATARWDEYYPGESQQGFMWRKMPKTMLAKCAEALALRKAFPKQLHGLYERAELDQAGEASAATVTATPSDDVPFRYEEEKPPAPIPTKPTNVCPECGKAAIIKGRAEWGGGYVCFKKKDGCGAKFRDGDARIEGRPAPEPAAPVIDMDTGEVFDAPVDDSIAGRLNKLNLTASQRKALLLEAGLGDKVDLSRLDPAAIADLDAVLKKRGV